MAPIDLSSSDTSNPYPASPESEEGCKHLYVQHERVVELPRSGTVTFRFKRGPVSITEGAGASPASASVDLSLYEIVDTTDDGAESEDDERPESSLDELFERARKEDDKETD